MRTPVAFVALATAAWLPTAAAVALLAPDASDGFAPRLVVKFRPAGDSGAPTADRVARLAADTGIALTHVRTMAVGAQVLTSSAVRSEEDADAIAGRRTLSELNTPASQRVRQIEAQALSRLRHPAIRRRLREYLG